MGKSKYKCLQNGFPQDSVLSPVLFNFYTSDFVNTTSRKFMYADDVGLVADSFEKLEEILNEDLSTITSSMGEEYPYEESRYRIK